LDIQGATIEPTELSTLMSWKTPWRRGFDAGLAALVEGTPYPEDNPFPPASRHHWSWTTGVMDAYGDEYPDC
jgi:hypothetical protein